MGQGWGVYEIQRGVRLFRQGKALIFLISVQKLKILIFQTERFLCHSDM